MPTHRGEKDVQDNADGGGMRVREDPETRRVSSVTVQRHTVPPFDPNIHVHDLPFRKYAMLSACFCAQCYDKLRVEYSVVAYMTAKL